MLTWVLWALLAAICRGQALGTWKMIAAKSREGSGPIAETITVNYEAHTREGQPNAETWTLYRVRANGISETTSQTLRFDGKEYPCGDLGLEERPDTVVAVRLGARTAAVSYRKSGRITHRLVRTVFPGGRQMTLEVRITPEKGMAQEHRLVFER